MFRWKVAIHEALSQRDNVELSDLIRLYIHEGLRIFQDRLTEQVEREWTDETINSIAMKNFSGNVSSKNDYTWHFVESFGMSLSL